MYGCPPLAQDGFEWFGRVIGCGHVSGLQARPVTTAGRYGDARALSHQAFLLPSTYLRGEAELNKFKRLESARGIETAFSCQM